MDQTIKPHHQEEDTCSQLAFVALFDQFALQATNDFKKKAQTQLLELDYESVVMDQLYADMSARIGESLLEALNLQLKHRFLIVPMTAAFHQGLTDNLVSSLVSRDPETSRQIFQLLIDEAGTVFGSKK